MISQTVSLVSRALEFEDSTHLSKVKTLSESFEDHQLNVLRYISVSSSSVSLLSGIIYLYFVLAIHPSKRRFRHQLISFVIIYDFLKALSIIIFPILTLLQDSREITYQTIQFLGFFTAFSIEGSDFSNFTFAVNLFLIVFFPKRSSGLYFIRYYIYALSIIIPAILASLAFINNVGYSSFDVWCYLPKSPKWYQLVLSWGPRYALMLFIIIVYLAIYIHLKRQISLMTKQQKQIHQLVPNSPTSSKLKYKLFGTFAKHASTSTSSTSFDETNNEPNETNNDPHHNYTKNELELKKLNEQLISDNINLKNANLMKNKFKLMSKQAKVIFLYPIAYFLLWVFPLIQNSLSLEDKSSYPIWCIVAFMQSSNCAIDTIVFLIREKPWNVTYEKILTSSTNNNNTRICKWRYYLKWLPLYHLPDIEIGGEATDTTLKEADLENQLDFRSLQKNIEFDYDPFNESNLTANSMNTKSKLNNSSELLSDAEDNDMDFIDFLNRGPPV